ncbi:MAG: hypothetical protein ACI82Z_000844 [Cellvibrionaceae bacterium]|jgi:hypothetical protein
MSLFREQLKDWRNAPFFDLSSLANRPEEQHLYQPTGKVEGSPDAMELINHCKG